MTRLILSTLFIALVSLHPHCRADTFTIGIGTHFGAGRNYLDDFAAWAKDQSISSFRDEMYWKDIEKIGSALNVTGNAQKTVAAADRLQLIGISPLLIYSYGNPLYDGGSHPNSDRGRQAFARYAAFVTKSLRPPIAEIWNEWNIGSGTKPRTRSGSVADYVELTREVSTSVKSISPEIKLLGGALGDDLPDWPWITRAMEMGILSYIDGISIHLYNYSNSRVTGGAEEFIRRIDRLTEITKRFNKGKAFPIYVTEVGWPNHIGLRSVDEQDAARDAAVFLLLARTRNNIKGAWFYEYRDGGNDPFDKEHHFGLTTISGEEKPISCSIKSFGKLVSQSVSPTIKTLPTGTSIAQIYQANGDLALIAWRSPSSRPHLNKYEMQLTTSATAVRQFTIGCNHPNGTTRQATNGKITFEVTESPIGFIVPKGKSGTLQVVQRDQN